MYICINKDCKKTFKQLKDTAFDNEGNLGTCRYCWHNVKKLRKPIKEKRESLKDRLQKDEERLERDENAWLALQESTNKEIAQLAGLVLRTRQYYKSEIRKTKLRLTKIEKELKRNHE